MGVRIRAERIAQKLTQLELADAAGLMRSTISLLERGETVHPPRLETVARIARALNVTIDSLYGEPMWSGAAASSSASAPATWTATSTPTSTASPAPRVPAQVGTMSAEEIQLLREDPESAALRIAAIDRARMTSAHAVRGS